MPRLGQRRRCSSHWATSALRQNLAPKAVSPFTAPIRPSASSSIAFLSQRRISTEGAVRLRAICAKFDDSGGRKQTPLSSNRRSAYSILVAISGACEKFTKSAQSTAPENIGSERAFTTALTQRLVNSFFRRTLENNEKIWPQPDRENAFAGTGGGEEGRRQFRRDAPKPPG